MNLIDSIPYLKQLPPEQQFLVLVLLAPVLVILVSGILRFFVVRFVLLPVRGFFKRTNNNIDDRALDILERPLRIFLIGAAIAIISLLFDFTGDIDSFTDNLSRSLFLVAIIYFVYNLVDVIGINSANLQRITGLEIEDRLLPFLRVVVKVIVIVIGVFGVVQSFGYDVTGLLASFGIIGLAFSLAAQDTAANVFGFAAIVSDDPFKVGDYIITNGIEGHVERVGVRSTRIRKLDQSLVTMPNSMLTNAAVTNWHRLSKRRLDYVFGVTYSTKAHQMEELMEKLREMLKVRELIDPESVQVIFTEFAASSLNIRLIAYVFLPDWGQFMQEQARIHLEVMKIVESLGLSMAFPSVSLYVESWGTEEENATAPKLVPASRKTAKLEEKAPSEISYQANETESSDGDSNGDDGGDER